MGGRLGPRKLRGRFGTLINADPRTMPREQPDVGTSAALDLRLHETLAYWDFPPGSDTPVPRGALGINRW